MSTERQKRKGRQSDPVAIAVAQIDRLIEAGHLVPGQRLVEADLVERLGISRVPVREALRILAGDGVVELMPNRGARVRSFTSKHVAEMLKALVALLCAGIEEFVESPQFDEGIRRLEAVQQEVAAGVAKVDGRAVLDAGARYEQTIFEIAGNSYLLELHRRVHFHHYNRQLVDAVGFIRLASLSAVYAAATQAIRQRDVPKATALFKATIVEMVEALRQSEAAPAPQPSVRATRRR